MKLNHDTNPEIANNQYQSSGEFTSSADIKDQLNHGKGFLLQGQIHWEKNLYTIWCSVAKNLRDGNTVISHQPVTNSWHAAGTMAQQLIIHLNSTLLNKLCKSDHVPTQALPLPQSSRNLDVPQCKAIGDLNVAQCQRATFDIAKWIMDATIFTKTPWPVLSNKKCSMVDQSWKLAI